MSDHAGRDDGRVYLNLSRDTSNPESQVHHDPVDEEPVEERRNRVAFLERSLERRSLEAERCQEIVAGLTQANSNLSARALELESPDQPLTHSHPSEKPTHDVANGAAAPRPQHGDMGAQNGSERVPWWRRVFGG